MISTYFGLPRCGKTTTATKHVISALRKGKDVFCNFPLTEKIKKIKNYQNYHYITNKQITFSFFKRHPNCLLVIDEGILFANSRDFKNFSKELTYLFCLHGHLKMDIELFSQRWNGLDILIRELSEEVFYIKRGFFFSKVYKIPYGVMFPENKPGEIIMGYKRPTLFTKKTYTFRPFYYKYFDSWESNYSLPVS